MSKPQRYTSQWFDNELTYIAKHDERINWKTLVEQGIANTQAVASLKKSKRSTINKHLPWIFAFSIVAFVALAAFAAFQINGPFFEPFEDYAGFVKDDAPQYVQERLRHFQLMSLTGILLGVISAFATYFSIEPSINARKLHARIKTELEMPVVITYEAKVKEKEQTPHVVITRTYPSDSNTIETDELFSALLSDDPVEAVEELDSIMGKLKEAQARAYEPYLKVLKAEGLVTKEQQNKRFSQMRDAIQRVERQKKSAKTFIKSLDEHAAHHNKANKEVFEVNPLTMLEDDIPDLTPQTAKADRAA